MSSEHDYWTHASVPKWYRHVVQSLVLSRELIQDWDHTYFEATEILSDVYRSLQERRGSEPYDPENKRSVDDYFWGLQRSSTVMDTIVGSACVVLMRWIGQVRWIATSSFVLLETKVPFEKDRESEREKWARHYRSVMYEFGSRVPGKAIPGALAVWQIGNVFKHGSDTQLRPQTREVARLLGFSSHLLGIPEHKSEENLRQMALREVHYTLGAESIERMGLLLGCGPEQGLMPLYRHVESWQRAIDEKLREEQEALQKLL